MAGQSQAKELQYSRRDLDDGRLFFRDLAIAEESSRDQARIDAVVAAPCLQIIFKDFARDLAHHRIPRGTESIAVADQQIRCVVDIRASVDRIAIEDAGN